MYSFNTEFYKCFNIAINTAIKYRHNNSPNVTVLLYLPYISIYLSLMYFQKSKN